MIIWSGWWVGHRNIWMQVSKIIVRWLFRMISNLCTTQSDAQIEIFRVFVCVFCCCWKFNHWNCLIILRLRKQLYFLQLSFRHGDCSFKNDNYYQREVKACKIVLSHNINFSPFSVIFLCSMNCEFDHDKKSFLPPC